MSGMAVFISGYIGGRMLNKKGKIAEKSNLV
jgi:hypothetical protein